MITRLMMRLSVGTHDNYPGLPAPAHHTLAEGPPIVNELLLYWIRHGRITVQSGLKDLQGNLANFVNGTTLEVDTLLWATGFNVALPFLAPFHTSLGFGSTAKAGRFDFPTRYREAVLHRARRTQRTATAGIFLAVGVGCARRETTSGRSARLRSDNAGTSSRPAAGAVHRHAAPSLAGLTGNNRRHNLPPRG